MEKEEKSIFDVLYERRIFEGITPQQSVLEEFMGEYRKDLPFVREALSAIERVIERGSYPHRVSDKIKTVKAEDSDFMTWRFQVEPVGMTYRGTIMWLIKPELQKISYVYSASFDHKSAYIIYPPNSEPKLSSSVAVGVRFATSKVLLDKSMGGGVYDVFVSVPRPILDISMRSRYLAGPDSRGRYELRNEYCYVIYTPYSSIDVNRIYDDWRTHQGDNEIYVRTSSGEKLHRAWAIITEHFGRGTTYDDIKKMLEMANLKFTTFS